MLGIATLCTPPDQSLALDGSIKWVHINAVTIVLDPAKDDANRKKHGISLDAAFMAGMAPSRRGRPKLETPKVEVKIRLDAKTVEHLRASGPGWQTRVNAALGQLVANGRI